MVDRFRPYYFDPIKLTGHDATMRQNREGGYVLASDYDALAAELAESRAMHKQAFDLAIMHQTKRGEAEARANSLKDSGDKTADLGCFSPEWAGWRLIGQDLISPEGWRIARGQVMIVPLMRQQLAAYEVELKRLRNEVVLIQEQPVPEAWPEWVWELSA